MGNRPMVCPPDALGETRGWPGVRAETCSPSLSRDSFVDRAALLRPECLLLALALAY